MIRTNIEKIREILDKYRTPLVGVGKIIFEDQFENVSIEIEKSLCLKKSELQCDDCYYLGLGYRECNSVEEGRLGFIEFCSIRECGMPCRLYRKKILSEKEIPELI